jgi:hypothetical protein
MNAGSSTRGLLYQRGDYGIGEASMRRGRRLVGALVETPGRQPHIFTSYVRQPARISCRSLASDGRVLRLQDSNG